MLLKNNSNISYLPSIDSCFRALDHCGTPQNIAALAIIKGELKEEVLSSKLSELSSIFPRLKSIFYGSTYPKEIKNAHSSFENNIFKYANYVKQESALIEVESIMLQEFNPDIPLWEFHIFPLKENKSLLLFRLHHSLGDGMSGLALFHQLFNYQKKERKNNFRNIRRQLPGIIPSLTPLIQEGIRKRPSLPLHFKNSLTRKINLYSISNDKILLLKKKYNCTSFSILLSLVSRSLSLYISKSTEVNKISNNNRYFRALVPVTIRGNEIINDLSNQIGGASVHIPLFVESYDDLVKSISRELHYKLNAKAYGAYHLFAKLCASFPLFIQKKMCTVAAKKTSGICTFLQAPSKELRLDDAILQSEYAIPALMPEHGVSIGFIKYQDSMNISLIIDPTIINNELIDLSIKESIKTLFPDN